LDYKFRETMANEIFVGGTVQKSDGSIGWSEGLRVEKITETVKNRVASVYNRLRYGKNNF
jgi:hypothetical protein